MPPTDPPGGSDPASAVDLLRRALALMEQVIEAEKQVAEATERSAALRREAEALVPGISTSATPRIILRDDATDDTPVNMNVDTRGKSDSVKRGISRSRREHPALTAFYRANKTVGEIAKELGEGRPRVSSWMSDEEPRPIPRRQAERLRDVYRIPLSAWKNLGK